MAKAKRKLLPKDFETLLKAGELQRLKAVFDDCAVDARGGYSKRTALAFSDCPDDLARWLVDQGADIEARDNYGETPLHSRAGHWQGRTEVLLELGADVHARDDRGDTPVHRAARVGNIAAARLLLAHGADAEARNSRQQTPLGQALAECSNARIESIAAMAELLLAVPAPGATGLRGLFGRLFVRGERRIGADLQADVRRIGADFEFHRESFNPDSVDATSAALDRLYSLFDVPPVPRRRPHDGETPIAAKAAGWEDRHQELWQLLVPSSGAAKTVQGEVIRISGRIHIEIEENGATNWDADYGRMGKAFLGHIASGVPLPGPDRERAATLVSEVRNLEGSASELCRLAVEWIALNPQPVPLPPPDYSR